MPKEVRQSTRAHSQQTTMQAVGVTSEPRTASTWSNADDEILMSARAAGMNWQPISAKHFPAKTANACRKRHERLMERRNAEEWDGVKLETLAVEYMNCRREMWQILANRVGEKWTLVEQKCMEKGFKNLQAAQRSAQRKERGIYGDDSGIDLDAENDIDDSPSSAHQAPFVQNLYGRGGMSIQTMLSPSPRGPQA
ncbi:hypothetical protein EJ05DRAFT_64581 [Pseudovirgaria hyperparasitica]|uniref:Myb-like domain-containing protein n=1 Tax=Pseudovirgaria hyperparasitica TaxID=470096 RepID=A0A6A6W5S6_9PEZI|nr:uncharacterized protein EJ05DRAFT_64581 [Pseudovirgaria hyperparasitica]KAF2756411.1 hypothetical protein EJ05DRAFT_64581 [Pseudovirgaria hyperparasitica]